MKKFLFIIAAVLMGCIVSCNKPAEGEDGFTLSVDKTEIVSGETVTFSVKDASGKDVSADFQVCEMSIGTCYPGMEVTLFDAGDWTFEAHRMSDQAACKNTVTVTVKAE